MKVNYEQLYSFEDPVDFFEPAFRVESIEKNNIDNSIPILKGEFKPDNQIPFQYYMGNTKPSSIIYSGMFDVLIEKNIVELLRENGITGYRLYDVIVFVKIWRDMKIIMF
ncbi:hypothetical protein [Bacillus sp. 1P06AnD]|uniref:hypothetical protein n=1 Tax=Bacillus sp. 1P06AnD TaxID=3132208 RepID=UPI0039A2AF1F